MYVGYEQVAATAAVKTVAALTVPANATHAELQARTAGVSFTMDNTTNPTANTGIVLLITEPPKLFLIEDILRIRFLRQAAVDAALDIHYIAGRDV